MSEFQIKDNYNTQDLIDLVRFLCDPVDGCSWDRVQTHASIRRCLLEEAYEAAQAIDDRDPVSLKEELGDLLFQVAMHADISNRAGGFDFDDVADGIVKKMVFRHPHLFGGETLSWEENKQREKGYKSVSHKCELVPKALPALMRAKKILRKGNDCGYEDENVKKVAEMGKNLGIFLDNEKQNCNNTGVGFGYVVLALTAYADHLGIDLEQATNSAIESYITRLKDWEDSEITK